MDFSYDNRYTKVALFMKNNKPMHACIQYNSKYWESKIGSGGIIRHDLFEIENNRYGQVVQIYKKVKNNIAPLKEANIVEKYNGNKIIKRFNDFINN